MYCTRTCAQRRRLRSQLDTWLAAVGAKFPVADELFAVAERAAVWAERQTIGMADLEEEAQAMLRQGWEPDTTQPWWGSQPAHTAHL